MAALHGAQNEHTADENDLLALNLCLLWTMVKKTASTNDDFLATLDIQPNDLS
jgi:hypothetical protein